MYSTTRLHRLKTASWTTTLMTSMVQLRRMIMQSLQHRRQQGQQQIAHAVTAQARTQPQLLRRVMLRALLALKQPCCRRWHLRTGTQVRTVWRGVCFLAGTALQLMS